MAHHRCASDQRTVHRDGSTKKGCRFVDAPQEADQGDRSRSFILICRDGGPVTATP